MKVELLLIFNIIMRMIGGKRYCGEDVHVEEARHFQDIIGKIFEWGATSNPIDFFASFAMDRLWRL